MSRLVLFAVSSSVALSLASLLGAGCMGCTKSAGSPDKVSAPPPAPTTGEVIAPPSPPSGGPSMGKPAADAPAPAAAGDNDRFKLKPQEGKLAIEAPTDVKAGTEAIAHITVTPGAGYHVNTEYPIKLLLTPPAGVTLAKDKFVAGGHDKAKGDADALDEKQLAIAVKLTAASTGSYTINGNFKFAVCDHDQCLAKQETIAIAVAAK